MRRPARGYEGELGEAVFAVWEKNCESLRADGLDAERELLKRVRSASGLSFCLDGIEALACSNPEDDWSWGNLVSPLRRILSVRV